ncbi:MAG: prepilin-type N-terminal cleavage/methylation domain-containing protein [Pseudomonadota bacterium]
MRPHSASTRGFTLVEVLISLAIFSFGMLGVAYLTTRSINLGVDNTAYRTAIQAARQYVEPLHQALRVGRTQFQTQLNAIEIGTPHAALFSDPDSVTSGFQITIVSALDDLGLPLGTDVTLWMPPLHLRVDVRVNDNLVFPTAHILVPL